MPLAARPVRFAVAMLLAAAASGTETASAKDDPRAKDVDFLLDELGKDENAGRLLEIKDVDWRAVCSEFRPLGRDLSSDADLVKLAQRIVARLRDGHACLTHLKVAVAPDPNAPRQGSPGVSLVTVGKRVHVRNATAEAIAQGLAPGAEVTTIDGLPARKWLDATVARLRDTVGFSTNQQAEYAACHWGLRGDLSKEVSFEVVQGKARRTIAVPRVEKAILPWGPVFPPADLKPVGDQSWGRTPKGFGYVLVRSESMQLQEELDRILDAMGDVPGLVLDFRGNRGGAADDEAVFARFLAPGQRWNGDAGKKYVGAGTRPFTGPLVVIVDAGTVSCGETTAGMFKEDGRGYMIGDTATAGMSSSKKDLTVPSGLFAVHFSVASNKLRFNAGRGIEGIGVPPHEFVPYDPEDLGKAVDTQIRRTEELLTKGFPGGKVLYRSLK